LNESNDIKNIYNDENNKVKFENLETGIKKHKDIYHNKSEYLYIPEQKDLHRIK